MKKLTYFLIAIGVLCFLLASPSPCQAISIRYDVTDLLDTTPGEDLWQYVYRVSGYTFKAGELFDVYFAVDLYKYLNPVSAPVDWDILAFQPDASIPQDGMYDALALADNASLTDPFVLSFVWLGSGVPGSQAFEVYDPSFEVMASGRTAPAAAPVPEPSTLLLV